MFYENPLNIIPITTHHYSYALFSIGAIILSCLTLLAIYRENSLHQPNTKWYQVAKDEYDFMASDESEQSRIDLAEAYIDIGHNNDAATILEELLNSPNPITKEKAKQLLIKNNINA
jgi:FimV-like protein